MISPIDGHGHYAGNVQLGIDTNGVPVFAGHLGKDDTFDAFQIELSEIVPAKPFAAMVTVIGAKPNTGALPVKVTV